MVIRLIIGIIICFRMKEYDYYLLLNLANYLHIHKSFDLCIYK